MIKIPKSVLINVGMVALSLGQTILTLKKQDAAIKALKPGIVKNVVESLKKGGN